MGVAHIVEHCTKMDADSLADNIPNTKEFICPICLPKFGISMEKGFIGRP